MSDLKFICPVCGSTSLELLMSGCNVGFVLDKISKEGSIEFKSPTVYGGVHNTYICAKCGEVPAKEAVDWDDDGLISWLSKQAYNKGE